MESQTSCGNRVQVSIPTANDANDPNRNQIDFILQAEFAASNYTVVGKFCSNSGGMR